MKLSANLFSITFFALATLSSTANAQTKADTILSNKPFVSWAKTHAITLQETDKAVGYNDLLPVKKMIGNARVVALGESTLNMPASLDFRNRLFKFLVEKCGFTTIVFESGLAETAVATTYVETGNGVAQQAAKNMTIAQASRQNIELMQWMRDYNAKPQHKNKLNFYGMDVQIIGLPGDTNARHAAIDTVLNYLEKVDVVSAGKTKTALMPFINRLSVAKYPAFSKTEHDQLSTILDEMTALITRERINYIAQSTKEEYEWVQHLSTVAMQTDRLARLTPEHMERGIPPDAWKTINMRDASMAENVLWLLNNRAHGKVLVFSHNGHTKSIKDLGGVWDGFAKAPNMMGQYLRSVLGNDLFLIGTSCAPMVQTAKPGSIDLALIDVGKPSFIVDLKAAAAADPKIKTWLNVPRPMETNIYTFFTAPMSSAFDALLFLDKNGASK